MTSHHPRWILPPGASRKRKATEALYSGKPSTPPPASLATTKENEPISSNRLLAGYMAYEFLIRGSIFGEKFNPALAEAVSLASSPVQSRRMKPKVKAAVTEPSLMKEHHSHSYANVASILKGGGAHIPGIVNPTQLSRWFQM
ncbi:putative Embryo sac development arrest 6 [Quillaja saponaria]|uniref:Embryo sac development arrest 6 n=1 Tax=Quillaja saponaria TaxID=32244 RepID=A0AAD7VLH6_QUISA|nr:putative Embryo sac development arrest 6 [Quillaja saponaria]